MDITPYTFKALEDKSPQLFGGELHYLQPSDDMQEGYDDQEIHIGSADSGGGRYFYIKTDRWAFDSADQLKEFLENAIARVND